MPRKTRANRTPSTFSVSPSRVEEFRNDKCRETFETLNRKRKIWAENDVSTSSCAVSPREIVLAAITSVMPPSFV